MSERLATTSSLYFPHRTTVVAPQEVADTGEKPILCLAADGQRYWCKSYDGLGAKETTVNEIISLEIGKAIGAPICDWAIVDIPEELAGRRFKSTVFSTLPLFGAKEVEHALTDDPIRYVTKDNNYHRLPRLIALWYICNAEDIQMMYSLTEDYAVYSVDQGYWFGSHEGNRLLSPVTDPLGQTQIPRLPEPIPQKYWTSAIETLEGLSPQALSHIHRCIPAEWEVKQETVDEIIGYAVSRIPYAIDKLRYYQKTSKS